MADNDSSPNINASIREAYEHFLDEVLGTEIVWGLFNGEIWATCDSEDFDDREVLPFWSNEHLAAKLCSEDWADFKPKAIRFDDFIDDWLHGMHDDNVMVGINWNEELIGAEIEPVWLIDDLLEE